MTRDKYNPHASSLVALFLSWLILSLALPTSIQAQVGGPDIAVWYGDNQTFGQEGVPQRWVNILGNVSDANGVDSLYYTLNGGSKVMLTIGSDGKRLQSSGDFNVDLATNDLLDGVNAVIIVATDNLDNRTEDTVTVNYTSTNVWPLPYAIDWQAPTPANEVSQAVDGHWEVTPDGLHTVTTGYDRLVAIGDTTWNDYEIIVPVTIHSAGGGSGIGVLLRWMGHTDVPVSCTQPKCGYLPLGAICWYRGNRLEIYGNGGQILATQSRSLTLDTTYIFKARVETNPGVGGQYSFKVWKQSEAEPAGWDITGQEALSDPQNGSLMLISHHGDVTYGNLAVVPISISITNVQALVHGGDTSATISWNTSVTASSQVAYGLTPAYELGTITDPTLVTSHSLGLMGLLQDTVYHYQISSVSAAFDTAFTGDLTFTTVSSDIVSDDFHQPLLNTSLWTFVDPLGGGGYTLTGACSDDAWINISVPAGSPHELWTNGIRAPHILQSGSDTDFELEVKFESSVSGAFQEQGILVKQDDANFMRFEFFSDASNTIVFAATLAGVAPPLASSIRINSSIGAIGLAPLYMRVNRAGDLWTQSYSTDGTVWTSAGSFTHALAVTAVGTYAGNAGSNPAHTSSVDYFFNNSSPIIPEDGLCPWTITPSAGSNGSILPNIPVEVADGGSQAFTITPDPGYHVLDVVTDTGSVGAVTSYTFTNVTADHTIAAAFELDATPVITSTPVLNGVVGQAYSYDVDATGTSPLTYNLLTFPAGMTINGASGLIDWTPLFVGAFPVSVEAINSAGADTQSYSILVVQAPVITSTPVLNGVVGQAYSYDVDATGDPVPTYALLTFPAGMIIDTVSGLISWTPAATGDFAVSVEATNVGGSDVQPYTLHVDLLPDVPTLISPLDASVTTNNTPTFAWSSTAGAGGQYTLEYATDAALSVGLVTVGGLTDTTYAVPLALLDDTYYWHVEAIDAGSLVSGYQASPFSFTLTAQPPAVPTLLSPADLATIIDNTPTLTWSATAGAGGEYALDFSTDSLFGTTFTFTGLTTESYTLTVPLADGAYFWRVNAKDQFGLESGYQPVPFKFNVDASLPSLPLLLTPPHLSFTTETMPTFEWTSVMPLVSQDDRSGATADAAALATYTLQYSTDPAFATATTVSGLPDTAYTVPGGSPLDTSTWYWHVEAVDDGGNHSGYQPTPFQFGIFVAGDVNASGTVTSSDIIHLVNYVFKGGAAPVPCAAAGDINCDGAVTSGDIIALVNFIFKGDAPPCNVGALIDSGAWNCP